MASLIYNAAIENITRGNIDVDSHAFKMLLVTSSYTADKDTHEDRADISGEVTGTNYTTGGVSVTVSITRDNTNDRVDIDLTSQPVRFSNVTISGIVGAVVYKNSGTSSTDWLLCFIDFGASYSPSGQHFDVSTTAPLRFQN